MEDFGDYDEDILGDENIDKFNNADDEEAALDKLIEENKVQTKKRKLKPRPKLTERELIGPKGYCALRQMFDNWKPKQKNPLDNVENMMRKFEYWGHSLAPFMNFHDFMERAMKLSRTAPTKTYMKKLRAGMPLFEEDEKDRPASPEEYDLDEETGAKILSKKKTPQDEDYDFEAAWQAAMGSGESEKEKNVEPVVSGGNKVPSQASSSSNLASLKKTNRTLAELSDEEEEAGKTSQMDIGLESDLEDEIPTEKILRKISDSGESSDEEMFSQKKAKVSTPNSARRRRVMISDDEEEIEEDKGRNLSPTPVPQIESPSGVKKRGSEKMSEVPERKEFGSSVQFILSCIGYAVGLGNIWRFPYLAFQHGGGAFLLPYLCCSFIIGLPILYLELSLGQFSKAGPAVVHGRLRPYAQGIGWGMTIMSSLVAINYNVIVAWVLLYLFSIITGQSYKWTTCGNPWNSENCVSPGVDVGNFTEGQSASDQYFKSVTLDGAQIGLNYYILDVNFAAAMKGESWSAAATQVCYSLAVGFGGLMSLSSYNPPTQNCFRDAIIITCADGFMSIFGGTAVFSVLGFMAKKQGVPIDKVVSDGLGLAFIAYPEAMNQISWAPWFWAFLFFSMLFLLGMSSQFGLAEVMCTALYDQIPAARGHRVKIVAVVCGFLFLGGLIMTTKAGIFYFTLFNHYSASFAVAILIFFEVVLIAHIYGIRNYIKDLRTMFGEPKSFFTKIIGPTSYYFIFIWSFAAPLALVALLGVLVYDQVTHPAKYGDYEFPVWSMVFGWFISVLPLFAVPVFVFYNIKKFKNQGKSLSEMFRVQPKWPSAWKFREEGRGSDEALGVSIIGGKRGVYRIRPVEEGRDGWTTFPVQKPTGKL
ncbi:hypothetical protein FO519_007473 [Halicephalobus sp. NKZ332]|nr:hypothetical protein FO519_007473 [Halicephalobus sp. NKZ332]